MIKSGIMGWPVAHSLSPRLHGHWLQHYGIRGSYALLPVEPDDFDNRIKSLAADGFAGCNLTIPFKTRALDLMDDLSPRAQAIGAVNTVVVTENGGLLGDNTDAYGYIQGLAHQIPDWRNNLKCAAVIGAGGAARAITYALLNENIDHIAVFNRTPATAEALAESFSHINSDSRLYAYALDALQARLPDYDLVINTTSLGMTGEPPLALDFSGCAPKTIVSDIVYRPRMTPFLAGAAVQGLRTAEGLHMLLYQAVPGFEYWFGKHPKIDDGLVRLMQAAASAGEKAA